MAYKVFVARFFASVKKPKTSISLVSDDQMELFPHTLPAT